ncbi:MULTISPECIES: peroxidase-related enzyme [Pontibacillus]|uniref:Peroxidase-related enzyme n=1 Tax=Pontibacillus chungwhensis TaxID=265426 RepID=A0ABY8UTX0_9BACI|nr:MULTISPECIES: peroxidase-related enzyme [Pontibacillus]MCD5323599.1 peroxidase-related enzyme [Pontibacillus sp. HN14]WIF96967.1 peroxidase-related enzyme [Pontibacillus chungwhensis]
MPWIKPAKQTEIREHEALKNMEQPMPLFNRLIANSPSLLEAFSPIQQAVKETFLTEIQRESLITFVSMRNGCDYCTKSHGQLLEELTDDEDILSKLSGFEEGYFDESLTRMLRYALKLTAKPVQVNKEDVLALKEIGLSETQIVEVNHVIAYTSYTNQISIGLGL